MNIFISNLSFRIGDDDLKSLFEEYGAVKSAKVITDKLSGRSRGFGFVEMEDAPAISAIEALNGKEMGGRALKINEAREPEQRERSFRPRFNSREGAGRRM